MRRLSRLVIFGCFGALFLAFGTDTSLATAPSGASAVFTVRATVPSHHFDSDDYKIFQKSSQDVVMRELTLNPGGTTGWLAHPGPQYVIITQGSLAYYVADGTTCVVSNTYTAGEGFVGPPGQVHMLRNEGSVTAVFFVTFMDVPVGGPFRQDEPRPADCPF